MSDIDLLARPHHDGSPLYVENQAPQLGETVTVRVRVPHAANVTELHVRQLWDAEPTFAAATVERHTDIEAWWTADVTCHNPVTPYRFLLQGADGEYLWLNGNGLHRRDVPDHSDFRLVTYPAPPAWAVDSIVYQVFPDRFARSKAAPPIAEAAPDWATPAAWEDPVDTRSPYVVGTQLFGGDLDGIREHLDHLERLGVTVLYLTPFFPARSNHRYDAATFDAVDPLLGGDAALDRLVAEAHRRGLRVLGDLTTNHTGDQHDWFRAARSDAAAPERDFYFFHDDGDYDSWLGVHTLPKLNHSSELLRERLFDRPDAPVRRWLSGANPLDGWRVDVANMTGRHNAEDVNHAVAGHMRRTLDDLDDPDGDKLLVGEHVHDHSADAQGSGWHGVMNYSGFTRPLWTWLRDKEFAPNFLGSPLAVPRLDGGSVAETIDEFGSLDPWRSRIHSFTLAGSHDTTRIRTLVGEDPAMVEVAAALLLTMPGIPMITYGDEIGMEGTSGEDGRRPMPWDENYWDARIFATYQALVDARRELDPLRTGGLRWVSVTGDSLTFVRESRSGAVLVHCARAAHEALTVPTAHLAGINEGHSVVSSAARITPVGASATLHADGPGYALWSWERQVPT
ncbi:alpha-glycosidase [Flexivirga endophytica]|uniref:Alpha-glycosidase n=1 Tax=Flexivirga endophytica TaxID=1849103 RepID=A0A916TG27_9MICO|nr:glycoside hydrolase family 13 protein [Flexivirga endophytica]GGB43754.1 alpha-glycosidase [Flexivirga endophytica]GHB68093.1 alpha-glycosidase [Flexivirga endophytica]